MNKSSSTRGALQVPVKRFENKAMHGCMRWQIVCVGAGILGANMADSVVDGGGGRPRESHYHHRQLQPENIRDQIVCRVCIIGSHHSLNRASHSGPISSSARVAECTILGITARMGRKSAGAGTHRMVYRDAGGSGKGAGSARCRCLIRGIWNTSGDPMWEWKRGSRAGQMHEMGRFGERGKS